MLSSARISLDRVRVLLDEAEQMLHLELSQARAAALAAEAATFPMWVKNTALQMLWCNKEYEALTGKTLDAYRGLRDADVWPARIAKSYEDNDQMVMSRKRSWMGEEYLPDGTPLRVLKWPVFVEDGALAGVCGAIIP